MEEPIYVFRTNEANVPKLGGRPLHEFLKKAVFIFAIAIVALSLIFQENMWGELSVSAKAVFIFLVVYALLLGRNKKAFRSSPVEIWFYHEYLVVYRPVFRYNRWSTRREFNTMQYAEIEKCVYVKRHQELYFYGTVNSIWYDVDKQGNVSQTPTYSKAKANTSQCIDCSYADDLSFLNAVSQCTGKTIMIE